MAAFSVATNNRFDLFVDEDEEPDELLTRQQSKAASERQRRDSEKRSSTKAKTKQPLAVAGKVQTQPNTAKLENSTTARAAPHSSEWQTCSLAG